MAKSKNGEASVVVLDSLFSLKALLEIMALSMQLTTYGSFYVADNFKCKIEC